ncbi:skin secretory protein xP2-like [Melozone crissalis]|uniref:skin secretory protein xP2-like n=1 Tax=Melozone crissalis TaxID=40204 RepID=UPI0023DCB4AC|nr:skin secretory protein xP2-like [Melozone crissalis]
MKQPLLLVPAYSGLSSPSRFDCLPNSSLSASGPEQVGTGATSGVCPARPRGVPGRTRAACGPPRPRPRGPAPAPPSPPASGTQGAPAPPPRKGSPVTQPCLIGGAGHAPSGDRFLGARWLREQRQLPRAGPHPTRPFLARAPGCRSVPLNNPLGQVTAGRYPLPAPPPGYRPLAPLDRAARGRARGASGRRSRPRPARDPLASNASAAAARGQAARARVIGRPPRSRDTRTPRATSSEKLPRRGGGGRPALTWLRAPPRPTRPSPATRDLLPSSLAAAIHHVRCARSLPLPLASLPPREAGAGARPRRRSAGGTGDRRRPRGPAASRRPASGAAPIGRSRPPTHFRSQSAAGHALPAPPPAVREGEHAARAWGRAAAPPVAAARARPPRGAAAPRAVPTGTPGPAQPPRACRDTALPPLPAAPRLSSACRVCKSRTGGWCAAECDVPAVAGAAGERRRSAAGVQKDFPRRGRCCRWHKALGPGRAPGDRSVCAAPTELHSHRSPSYRELRVCRKS